MVTFFKSSRLEQSRRPAATDKEMMSALRKARAELPKDKKVTVTALIEIAPKHFPLSSSGFASFLSERATDKQREELGLSKKRKMNFLEY